MMTAEERLEAMKETVADQKAKINSLDKKVDDLEKALRAEQSVNKVLMKFLKDKFVDEQAVNKVLMKFLEDKFGSEFIEGVESNL